MAVIFGAGAFLRAARYGPAGLTPPQHLSPLPPPPPPPPPPAPPVPITDQWWAGETNRSYDYAQCDYRTYGNRGCPLSPLLGITDTFAECKQLCRATNVTRCTSCGWIPGTWQQSSTTLTHYGLQRVVVDDLVSFATRTRTPHGRVAAVKQAKSMCTTSRLTQAQCTPRPIT